MVISKMHRMPRVRRVIFHHAAYEFKEIPEVAYDSPYAERIELAMRVFNMVDSWHLARWSTGCGYHFVIGNGHGIPDGHINIWRHICYQGAHCKGQNHDSVGIMLMGNLAEHMPSQKQIEACIEIAKRKCALYTLNPLGTYSRIRFDRKNVGPIISGHKDWRGHETNDCPGSLHKLLPEIRTAVDKLLVLEAPISTVYYKGEK